MLGAALGALLCLPASGHGALAADDAAKGGAVMGKADYSEIYEKNVFDPNRQPWSDKIKQADPAVPALAPGDVEVYGVMSVGDYKKAIVKLGPAFKVAPVPGARPFVMLAVGQALGPYTLVEISEKNIVFEGGGARYPMSFAAKKDRPPPSAVAPAFQVPVVLPAPVPTMVPGIEPIAVAEAAPAAAPAPAPPPSDGQAPSPAAQQQPASPSAASQQAAAASAAPIQGRTLLEAIEAAAQAKAAGTLSAPPPNPFAK